MLHEYLLGYGIVGDFGRFRPLRSITCQRGDRAVVRSYRGVELGVVLCEAEEGHATFLPNTSVGEMLRLAEPDDVLKAERLRERAEALFVHGREVAAELRLPVEVMDAEILLDGEQAFLHCLRWADFDERDLVSALARRHEVRLALHHLEPASGEHEEEEHGCGRPNCGRTEGGGCSTCGTGGGCSTCGTAQPDTVRDYFAGLREQMEAQGRTPLL